MSLSAILLIIIILSALILFSIETLPTDVVALAVMMALILSGVLPPDQAFAGFGSDTAMMILGLLLLSTALIKTGVVQMLTRRILKSAGENGRRLYWIITLAVAGFSGYFQTPAHQRFQTAHAPRLCCYPLKLNHPHQHFHQPGRQRIIERLWFKAIGYV